jgi:FKBP-type peptidyl-prolyl cis-trans isomerase
MKEQGERTAELPPALAYNNPGLAKNPYASTKPIHLKLKLEKSSPQITYEPHSIQVFDKEQGKGDPAVCMDTIRVQYVVRTLDGKQIIDTEADKQLPLTLTLGKGRAPFGIEEALVGIREGGVRTAILFPEVMKRQANENQIPLAKESEYPQAGLIFEFKRIADK